MMENAGRNLAHLARKRFLDGDARGRRVLVLAGSGGNGGGGSVYARRLHNWGATVHVLATAAAERFAKVPRYQMTVLQNMEVEVDVAGEETELENADVIVDAVIGYSLRGAPTGPAASLIRAANTHAAPVLALDVPSRIDTATGTVYDPSIKATATMTLALPKHGLDTPEARTRVGELYLADIGVTPELYAQPNLGFEVGSILEPRT